MISSIRGQILAVDTQRVVIEVGGIGIEVFVTRAAQEQCREGSGIFLQSRLIVREDSLTLYGFAGEAERDLFDILIKVNGVGPKLAVTILSTLSIDNLRSAVSGERPELLTRVPGIGKKTAQKILLELKDKLPVGLDAVPAGGYDDINMDVMDALIGLGFSVVEAQTAIQALPNDTPEDTQERIRLSLQYLSN